MLTRNMSQYYGISGSHHFSRQENPTRRTLNPFFHIFLQRLNDHSWILSTDQAPLLRANALIPTLQLFLFPFFQLPFPTFSTFCDLLFLSHILLTAVQSLLPRANLRKRSGNFWGLSAQCSFRISILGEDVHTEGPKLLPINTGRL